MHQIKHVNPYSLALISLFFGLGATAVQAKSYEKVVEHVFEAGQFEKSEFKVDLGDISLSNWDNPNLSVVIRLTFEARNQEKADGVFNDYNIRFTEQDGIARTLLKKETSKWSRIFFWRDNPEIEIGIQAPKGVEIRLETGAGNIRLADVVANLNITTGAGDVECRNTSGSLKIATGSGDVNLVNYSGPVQAATGAGDFEASGNITSFEVATGKGDVDLESTSASSEKSVVATGMGDIYVSLPGNADFQLVSEVGWGDISCQFDVQDAQREKRSLRGTVNAGGPELVLAAGFGDIDIYSQTISE